MQGCVLETTVSPFHCLYQDALELHTQSRLRLPHSQAEASRLARAAFVLYLSSAEALAHQAVAELGRPELVAMLADPARPVPLVDVWLKLPAIIATGAVGTLDPNVPPWPQFRELLELRDSWLHPHEAEKRRAYYYAPYRSSSFEPILPHQVPKELGVSAHDIQLPRTGLPRDPYALRPLHLDTVRAVLDAAIQALDHVLGGALTRDGRLRKEPVRQVYPPPGSNGG